MVLDDKLDKHALSAQDIMLAFLLLGLYICSYLIPFPSSLFIDSVFLSLREV